MAKKVKSGVKNTNKGTNTPTWNDRNASKGGKIMSPKVTKAPPMTIKGGGNRGS